MRERKSFWIFLISFVETVDNFVDNFEESLLFGEAKAVIDADLRLDVLHRLPVAAVQEAVCRGYAGAVRGKRWDPMLRWSFLFPARHGLINMYAPKSLDHHESRAAKFAAPRLFKWLY